MNRVRGFEVVKKYEGQGLTLPRRQTLASAGYDIEAARDITIPSIWSLNFVRIFRLIRNGHDLIESDFLQAEEVLKPILVPTGIKAYMPEDEVLILANRSSNTFKRNLSLPNGIGVIDSDYYNNPNNEGEIFVQVLNYGVRPLKIKKGERIAQGIFIKYLKTDDDQPIESQRLSGFGSTGKKGRKEWPELEPSISAGLAATSPLLTWAGARTAGPGTSLKKKARRSARLLLKLPPAA